MSQIGHGAPASGHSAVTASVAAGGRDDCHSANAADLRRRSTRGASSAVAPCRDDVVDDDRPAPARRTARRADAANAPAGWRVAAQRSSPAWSRDADGRARSTGATAAVDAGARASAPAARVPSAAAGHGRGRGRRLGATAPGPAATPSRPCGVAARRESPSTAERQRSAERPVESQLGPAPCARAEPLRTTPSYAAAAQTAGRPRGRGVGPARNGRSEGVAAHGVTQANARTVAARRRSRRASRSAAAARDRVEVPCGRRWTRRALAIGDAARSLWTSRPDRAAVDRASSAGVDRCSARCLPRRTASTRGRASDFVDARPSASPIAIGASVVRGRRRSPSAVSGRKPPAAAMRPDPSIATS